MLRTSRQNLTLIVLQNEFYYKLCLWVLLIFSLFFYFLQHATNKNIKLYIPTCKLLPRATTKPPPYALLSINIICRLHDTFHLPRKCFFEALLFKLFQNMHPSKLRLFPSKILFSCFKDTKMTTFTTKWYPLSLWLTSSMQNAR